MPSIGAVVVGLRAALECEELVDKGDEVGVLLHEDVEDDIVALEEPGGGLDTVVLVGLAAAVGGDGDVVAALVAFGVEVVDELVHSEKAFDDVGDVEAFQLEVFVEVVEPGGALGAGAPAEVDVDDVVLTPYFADKEHGFVVSGGFVGKVAVEAKAVVLLEGEHLSPYDIFVAEDGTVLNVDVHELAHEGTIRDVGKLLAPVGGIGFLGPFGGEVVEVLDGADFEKIVVCGIAVLKGLLLFLQEKLVEAVGDAVLVEVVVGVDEAVGGIGVGVEGSPDIFGDEFDGFAHEAVIVDVAFVVDVVDDDVVWTVFVFAGTTGGLHEAEGGELDTVDGGEIAIGPIAVLESLTVIAEDALVVLELCLKGGKELAGFGFGFANEEHVVEVALYQIEEKRDAHVYVHGFGGGAVPLGKGANVAVLYDFVSQTLVEPCAGFLGKVGEIVAEPAGVVGFEMAHALDFLRRGLVDADGGGLGNALAMLVVVVEEFIVFKSHLDLQFYDLQFTIEVSPASGFEADAVLEEEFVPTGELDGGGGFLLGHPDVELAKDVHDGADIDFLVELVDGGHDFAELVGLDVGFFAFGELFGFFEKKLFDFERGELGFGLAVIPRLLARAAFFPSADGLFGYC
nr:MAG TPA: hypothetical protein [Caudoviricetes sp.]